jgi:predicted HTH domain antitoxin
MPHVSTEILRDTMDFLSKRLDEGKLDDMVQLELLARGFEEKLAELYEQFQRSECSFGYMAEQLGVTTWDLYDVLERRGLRTTNV